jgi:hypothetical protein
MSSSRDNATQAKEKTKQILASLNVDGSVGLENLGDGFGVKINLSEPPPSEINLPQDIDGVPVRVEVVGNVRKLGSAQL